MSDNGHPDPPEPQIDPKVIQEAIRQALASLGIDMEDEGEIVVAQVTGPQAFHVMHNLIGSQVTGPETSWIPRFMSDMVVHNSALTMQARPERTLEELARTEEQITEVADEMPELNLEDYEAYLAWKMEAETLIMVVDQAVERWRDNAKN